MWGGGGGGGGGGDDDGGGGGGGGGDDDDDDNNNNNVNHSFVGTTDRLMLGCHVASPASLSTQCSLIFCFIRPLFNFV